MARGEITLEKIRIHCEGNIMVLERHGVFTATDNIPFAFMVNFNDRRILARCLTMEKDFIRSLYHELVEFDSAMGRRISAGDSVRKE